MRCSDFSAAISWLCINAVNEYRFDDEKFPNKSVNRPCKQQITDPMWKISFETTARRECGPTGKKQKKISHTPKCCVQLKTLRPNFRWNYFVSLGISKTNPSQILYDQNSIRCNERLNAKKYKPRWAHKKTALKSTDTANTQESHLFHWQHTFILFRHFFRCFVFEKKK